VLVAVAAASALTGVITDRGRSAPSRLSRCRRASPPRPWGSSSPTARRDPARPQHQAGALGEPVPRRSKRRRDQARDKISTDDISPRLGRARLPIEHPGDLGVHVQVRRRRVRNARAAAGRSVIVAGELYGQDRRAKRRNGPMYLGVRAVIVKSFARIHRSNLINWGIVPSSSTTRRRSTRSSATTGCVLPAARGPCGRERVTVVNEHTGAASPRRAC